MLFFRRKKQVWYVPVFAVQTYDDRFVWRRRYDKHTSQHQHHHPQFAFT
jgi:hypothetical protein